jgi:hypothetical protein
MWTGSPAGQYLLRRVMVFLPERMTSAQLYLAARFFRKHLAVKLIFTLTRIYWAAD